MTGPLLTPQCGLGLRRRLVEFLERFDRAEHEPVGIVAGDFDFIDAHVDVAGLTCRAAFDVVAAAHVEPEAPREAAVTVHVAEPIERLTRELDELVLRIAKDAVTR